MLLIIKWYSIFRDNVLIINLSRGKNPEVDWQQRVTIFLLMKLLAREERLTLMTGFLEPSSLMSLASSLPVSRCDCNLAVTYSHFFNRSFTRANYMKPVVKL